MSIFSALEKRVSAEVDRIYSEPTLILWQEAGKYLAGVENATKMSVDAVGVIDFNPVALVAADRGQYDAFQPVVEGHRIHISYALSNFSSQDQVPTQNCIIIATERKGQPKFKVNRVDPDGIGRIICVCTPQ